MTLLPEMRLWPRNNPLNLGYITIRIQHPDCDPDYARLRPGSRGGGFLALTDCQAYIAALIGLKLDVIFFAGEKTRMYSFILKWRFTFEDK